MKKAVFIGAGNVAWHLAHWLPYCGCSTVQIFSRTITSAQTLAMEIGADFTNDFTKIFPDADIYIYAVADDVLSSVIQNVSVGNGLHIHTSGSMEMNVFAEKKERFGVIYPFQTFSKQKTADIKKVPLFIEANNAENLITIENFAKKISENVYKISSEQRKIVHLSGVFACNFTNHLWNISYNLLKNTNLPFNIIIPLIEESVAKLHYLSPKQAQTGPAVRGDKNVISKHLQMLENHKDLQEIYKIFSEQIINF
jgi:predicted short-subunit dehydrogenase-like oxidoreductase (DUF2520 family)